MRISDWSSDVCSSDLRIVFVAEGGGDREPVDESELLRRADDRDIRLAEKEMAVAVDIKIRDQCPITDLRIAQLVRTIPAAEPDADIAARQREQIGRASCRERVCQ